jgi:hypothetical protein
MVLSWIMRSFEQTSLLPIALLVLTTMVASGCGDGRPARVPISGLVMIDGKPLSFGDVMFVPEAGRASQSKLDQNGRFILTCFGDGDGAVLGKHMVTITAGEPISSKVIRWRAPKKFANVRTSGITEQITGPNDNLVINISWEGGREFDENIENGEDEVRPTGRKS